MKTRHFFTLIEMVLVFTASTVTLLLFTAAVSSSEAKIAACTEQLKSLEQITSAYENDFGGTLISGNNNGRLWGSALASGGYFRKTGFFTKNGNQPKVMECPAETRSREGGGKKFEHPTMAVATSYDYGVNWLTHAKLTNSRKTNVARSTLKNPAQLIRITEGTKFALFHVPESVTDRHGEDAGNVLFEDGHITFMKEIPYKDASNYKSSYWR